MKWLGRLFDRLLIILLIRKLDWFRASLDFLWHTTRFHELFVRVISFGFALPLLLGFLADGRGLSLAYGATFYAMMDRRVPLSFLDIAFDFMALALHLTGSKSFLQYGLSKDE